MLYIIILLIGPIRKLVRQLGIMIRVPEADFINIYVRLGQVKKVGLKSYKGLL